MGRQFPNPDLHILKNPIKYFAFPITIDTYMVARDNEREDCI